MKGSTKICWKIEAFSDEAKNKNLDKLAIRAGDYCRLFHKEHEGFINVKLNDTDIRASSGGDGQLPATDVIFDEFLPKTVISEAYQIHLRLSKVV